MADPRHPGTGLTISYPATGTPQHLSAHFDGDHDAQLTITRTDHRQRLLLAWAQAGVWSARDYGAGEARKTIAHQGVGTVIITMGRVVAVRERWLVIEAPSEDELRAVTGLGQSAITTAIRLLRHVGVLTESELRGGRHYRLYFTPGSALDTDHDADDQLDLGFDRPCGDTVDPASTEGESRRGG